jgi:hypothetical protein
MRYALTRIGALLTISCTLAGCATISDYWRRPTKAMNMPHNDAKTDPDVATISLDASRRLVISQKITAPRFTCPEPPPDVALNTLSQTLASAQTKAGASANVGSLYSAIAQILSTRTSTVELWRTTSSTYCVLLMNGRDTEAWAYLEAAKAAIAQTKDTMATLPVAADFPALIAAQEAQKKAAATKETAAAAQADSAAAQADADAKSKQAAAELTAAKAACAKVAEADEPNDENCKKVKAAAASTAGG